MGWDRNRAPTLRALRSLRHHRCGWRFIVMERAREKACRRSAASPVAAALAPSYESRMLVPT